MRWFIALALAVLLAAGMIRRAETVGRYIPTPSKGTWHLPRRDAQALHVRTLAGGIVVVPGEREQIEVTVIRRVHSVTPTAAATFLPQITVERRREGDRWVVEANWPRSLPRGIESAAVDLEVRLPPGMSLDADTGAGNVEVRGSGNTRLQSGAGQVTARDVRGELNAGTGAGNIEAAVSPVNDEAKVDLRSDAGNLVLRLPRNSSARVEAGAGVGTVEMEPGGIGRLNRGHGYLEAVLGEGKGSVHLHAGVGNVRIQLTPSK